jgi:hypothetical protein
MRLGFSSRDHKIADVWAVRHCRAVNRWENQQTSYIFLVSRNVRSLNHAESYAAGAAGQPQ